MLKKTKFCLFFLKFISLKFLHMKNKLLIIILIATFNSNAQIKQSFWENIDESQISITGKREIVPEKYKTYHLNIADLKNSLLSAPNDKVILIDNSTSLIILPMPNGELQKFKIVEAPIMEMPLQISFPNIKTYSIKGVDDVYANGKIDITEFGFHGMIRSPKGNVFIDPYCQRNITDYISYYTDDFEKPINERGICEGIIDESGINNSVNSPSALICAGPNLRTYRLAIACTGQYAIAATGSATPTTAQTLAKVVTSVNRVDGVYESEVSIRLVLVSTTTLTLYLKTPTTTSIMPAPTATAQPFTGNSNASTLINESQTIINNQIGSANYDIGHTFSTGGGGLANLGCVCGSSKAKGITGSSSPVGDPYDIDYVAHEMGHQFRGNHTFRAASGSCSGNGNYGGGFGTSTAVEPGSGVSIMAYAGICGSTNDLAAHSIAYFHAVSFDEIMAFTTTGTGNSCDVVTSTGNNAPVVAGISAYTIPVNTPFILNGSATDPDAGDVLTFQWEEMDVATTSGNWNVGTKPFFRSYDPTSNSDRMFPTLAVVLSGNLQGTKGEYVPTTAQTLNFRLTVRDNKMGGGGVCSANTQVIVDGSGPFAVTSQSTTGIVYAIGSSQTITWDVNGTDIAPVNCSNVNIYISKDAGVTYTLVLANTPNDGSQIVTMPNLAVTSSTCRVKVESVGNIFFDLNSVNFTISTAIGINEQNLSQAILQLTPNPFSSFVKIEIINHKTLDVSKAVLNVYDILGHVVKTIPVKLYDNFSREYDFSDLANGSYIVEVTDGKQKAVSRLIKM